MNRSPAQPSCAFCAAPWSDRMVAAFEATLLPPCACCGGSTHATAPQSAIVQVPTEALICDACGRTLFTIPARV
ncbi:hypothetical protein U1769_21820 [Sphingomonas sp. ZT3P38]|uniref:hypothetical protein n=1 Tax=Parasphingomonas zepuensis TaxID=3096161 RepID=UPI002FC9C1BF